MILELEAVRVFGRHGAYEEERREGRTFLVDARLDVGDAGASDLLEEAVDYDEVARALQEVSDAHSYHLLEALAGALADELLQRFGAALSAAVRVRKLDIRPGGLEADWTAVTAERVRA